MRGTPRARPRVELERDCPSIPQQRVADALVRLKRRSSGGGARMRERGGLGERRQQTHEPRRVISEHRAGSPGAWAAGVSVE